MGASVNDNFEFDLSDPVKAKRLFDAIMGQCVMCHEHPAMDKTNRLCEQCFTDMIDEAEREAKAYEYMHPVESELFKANCKAWLRDIGVLK